jgi:excinuclease ABC subunit C
LNIVVKFMPVNTAKNDMKLKLVTLPESPGVYQFFDLSGKIIYVGKAKNIKKRVSSYFNKTLDNNKTRMLVRQIFEIKYIVVETELDALLLENNLIKTYQPKYNIQLKDDKTFPWIVVKNEPFPRIFSTRQKWDDGSTYYGPYPNIQVMNALLLLIREMYPLRTCSLDLNPSKIKAKKFSVCLEYHLKRCLGPCEGKQEKEEYDRMIEEIHLLLKGKTTALIQTLKLRMQMLSNNYLFEDAQELKLLLAQIEKYKSKSTIVSPKISDLDVFTFAEEESCFFVNYLVVREGAIIHAYTNQIIKKLDETSPSLINFVLPELREKFGSNSKEVLVDQLHKNFFQDFQLSIPLRGDKKKLIELSQRNIAYYKLEKQKKEFLKTPESSQDRILKQVKTDFRLSELPIHMECFDNSNFQGTNAVSACVVFKNGKPAKKDYRHFNVKTVNGPDDFATMREIVFRRYKRMLEEEQSLPQLIIIDGGKGQLSAALEALEELNLRGKVAIVGIAKKLEEIFFPGDQFPIYLDKRSESLKVIQFMRNEAHRFGISHHRNKRSAGAITSELDVLNGIGEKTKEVLFKEFKTIKNMRSKSLEELEKIIGKVKALKVYNFLNPKN